MIILYYYTLQENFIRSGTGLNILLNVFEKRILYTAESLREKNIVINLLSLIFLTYYCLFSFQKGDILLAVNGTSLLGLSHTAAVSQVKGNTESKAVTLKIIEAPETSDGPGNFVPSWLYWQNLPR